MNRATYLRWIVLLSCVLTLLVSMTAVPAAAQVEDLLSISVEAGFDGRFRPNMWFPLRIEVANRGADITGRIVVRPETSGNALANTFSTPVDLAGNSNQTLFLNITARSSAGTLRVELLNDDDVVIGSRDVSVRDILPRDQMYVVVTSATGATVDLTGVKVGGYEAFQANWSTTNVPTRAPVLDAVNVMVFSDVDTGTLSPDQRTAIRQWVISGGHLIVTGGPAWQSTAAGLEDLLPLVPDDSETSSDLDGLLALTGNVGAIPDGDTIIATGELMDDATVLAENESGVPLVARRYLGNGLVDYLAEDPANQPLRDWDGLNQLWLTLLTFTESRPSWTYGFSNWDRASTSIEILPGIDLLPAALSLIAFLTAYIALVGPLNYIILNRLNRREWAWLTIPVLILIFSGLAYSLGFELRGNRATLSRLTVVQTFPESEEARLDQLIGLLAPRRSEYSLSMSDERTLRPVIDSGSNTNVLGAGLQSDTNIQQGNLFEAVDFPVDASFIVGFSSSGMIQKPQIGGQLTLAFSSSAEAPIQTLQGVISNDSEITLEDPVLLARGYAYYLDGPLEPGDLVTISTSDMTLTGEGNPAVSPMEYAQAESDPFLVTTAFGFRTQGSRYVDDSKASARDLLGQENFQNSNFSVSLTDDERTQEVRRRQAFLESFVVDQFATTGRGNRVYLAGWINSAPTQEEVNGASYDVVDTTLYIIELTVTVDDSREARITPDQFTWMSLERIGAPDIGPVEMSLLDNTLVEFRFTPVPNAVLSEVDQLTLIVDRNTQSFSFGTIDLWNWDAQAYERINTELEERFVIRDGMRFDFAPEPVIDTSLDSEGELGEFNEVPEETEEIVVVPRRSTSGDLERFLGPNNAVQIRITRDTVARGSFYVNMLGFEQEGEF